MLFLRRKGTDAMPVAKRFELAPQSRNRPNGATWKSKGHRPGTETQLKIQKPRRGDIFSEFTRFVIEFKYPGFLPQIRSMRVNPIQYVIRIFLPMLSK